MIYLKAALFFEIIAIAGFSLARNPDPFSPSKFYLLFSVFFSLAIYFQEVRMETLLCYFVLIQLVGICVFMERTGGTSKAAISDTKFRDLLITIWILTIPPLLVILFNIYEAGGILSYLGSLYRRVEMWRGRGIMTMLLNFLPALNLLYFGAVLAARKTNSFARIALYSVHFLLFLTVGLMSGSRSYIGVSILGMCLVWGYSVGFPRIRNLVVVAVILVMFAGVMGAVRNSYREGMSLDSVVKMFSSAELESAQMAYGVSPLEVIFSAPERLHLLGATYLTLFTNVIPRSIWKGKPDTGAIIFTREYTPDRSGLSYFATGSVTEAILNFGKPAGVFIGLAINAAFLFSGVFFYNTYAVGRDSAAGVRGIFGISLYFFIVLAVSKISYGEFTDVLQTMFLFQIFPLVLVGCGYYAFTRLKKPGAGSMDRPA